MSERTTGKYSESATEGQHAESCKNQRWRSNRQIVLGSGGGLRRLALIGRALKIRNAAKDDATGQNPNEESHWRGKITDHYGGAAADGAEHIEGENGAAVAET